MSTDSDQSRWLIPTSAVLTVAGLVPLGLATAAQVWLVVVASALGVIGNGLGLWSQLASRRPEQDSARDMH